MNGAGSGTATGSSDGSRRSHSSATDTAPPRRQHTDGSCSSGHSVQAEGYTVGKTLGTGSMSKVKLATHTVTGEKVLVNPSLPAHFSSSSFFTQFAVKILPRTHISSPPTNLPPDAAKSRDASDEIRALREAAVSTLLHHPWICGMREMIVHQHNYYMFFEYINGGQLLDYLISHGRLEELTARKLARQIGSALSYCHRNNVVHRSEYLIYPSSFILDLRPRSENWKRPHLTNFWHKDHRFRPVKSIQPSQALVDLLRIFILRCPRNLGCEAIHRPGGGCVEFWGSPLRLGVWEAPF